MHRFEFCRKNGSLLWCTESFSILILPPNCNNGMESNYNGTLAEDHWNLMHLEPNSEQNNSNEVTLLGYPRSSAGIIPGSYCDMEELNRKEVSVLDINHQENDHSEIKVAEESFTKTSQTNVYNLKPDTVCSSAEKTSCPGPVNGNSDDFSSCKPEDPKSNLAKVDAEFEDSNKGSSPDHFRDDVVLEINNCPSLAEVLTSKLSMFKKYSQLEKLALIPRLTDCKHTGLSLDAKDNTNKGLNPHLTYFHPLGNQCSAGVQSSDTEGVLRFQHSSFSLLAEGRNDLGKMGMAIESYPSDEGKADFHQLLQKNRTALVESPRKQNENPIQKKDKEKVPDAEESGSISKEKDDSNDSVESSNSKRLFSTGKRVWSFEPDMPVRSKRLKKLNNDSSCSGSLLRQDSSFMNWISNVTRGSSRFHSAETPSLALDPNPSHYIHRNLCPPPTSHDKKEDMACRTMGFQTIFQSLSHPSLKEQYNKSGSFDHQEESGGSKELQVADRPLNFGSGQDVKLQKPVPISSERFNRGICQFSETLPTIPNTCSNNFPFHEKAKYQVGKGSSSSFQNDSSSPSEGKWNRNLGSIVSNKSSNLLMTNNRSGFLGNLWITRLCQKVSAPISHTAPCYQDMTSAIERLTDDCNMFLPHSENDLVAVKYHNNLQDLGQGSSENQNGATNGQIQDNSISPPDSCCSKRIHTDQKLKSNLNPILPSQRLKNSEPMASVFAKRLDALRHIRTSEVADDVTCAGTTCLFCGKSGHIINECFEIIGSELEDLQKNISSYDGVENSSCLCIRCFQLNHWAITCPHVSLKSSCASDVNTSTINPEDSDKIAKSGLKVPGKHTSFPNHDATIFLKNKDEQCQFVSEHTIPCGENISMGTELIARTNFTTDVGDSLKSNRMAMDSNPVKEDLVRESRMNEKQNASSSWGTESKGNQVIPLCNFVTLKIPDEQTGIFYRIRKLRLSRPDIIRWMRSPTPHFSLEGFYLRLRLGRCEEDLGRTGYNVASIVGASQDTLHGSGKSRIFVNIGGFRCLIDCRFVSNHDFVENEIKAWWSETLKGGGKLPSEEELDKKLEERKKFDF